MPLLYCAHHGALGVPPQVHKEMLPSTPARTPIKRINAVLRSARTPGEGQPL